MPAALASTSARASALLLTRPLALSASVSAPVGSSSSSSCSSYSSSSARTFSASAQQQQQQQHRPLYQTALAQSTRTAAAPHHRREGTLRLSGRGMVGKMMMHSSAALRHGSFKKPAPGTGLKVTFRDASGNDIKTVEANEGDDLLTLAHAYGIDLEGACEGSIACSTCHVILEPEVYDKLEEPSDDENDMLDLAFGLTDTSRLGCQVKVTKATDGMVAQLPAATRNMYVDGHKPSHH
ncbi:mitochondrial matrix iron-sulfur protein [Tilletia horrida]|nr:mitochondrial matrix iron-sulfur protein [Tilletia horrida]